MNGTTGHDNIAQCVSMIFMLLKLQQSQKLSKCVDWKESLGVGGSLACFGSTEEEHVLPDIAATVSSSATYCPFAKSELMIHFSGDFVSAKIGCPGQPSVRSTLIEKREGQSAQTNLSKRPDLLLIIIMTT
jgi:hypothetical protein